MIEDNDQHEQVRTIHLPFLLNNFENYSKYMVDILQISLIMVLTKDSTNITKYCYKICL